MSGVLLCAACLNNEVDLIHIDSGQLRDKYNAICGIETQHVKGAYQYLCVMCVAHLNKMMKLRELCLKSAQAFQQVANSSKEEIKKCTEELLDITPILSFPKFDTFTYSEINHNIKNGKNKLIYGRLSKTSTLCYEVNDKSDLTEASNKNESSPKVIITEDIKLDVSYPKPEVTHNDIVNENSNNYDTIDNQDDVFDNKDDVFDNQENMFDTNNSNTSYPNTNTAVINLNENSNQTQINLQNNSQIEKPVITDSIQLPEQAKPQSKKLRVIEYFAKLDLLSENEAKASYELIALSRTKESGKQGLIQCAICSMYFAPRFYYSHINDHKNPGKFQCSTCLMNFIDQSSYYHHIVTNHMFKYICRVCSEVSFTMQQAENHYRYYHCSSHLEYRLKLDQIENTIKSNGKRPSGFLQTLIPNYFTKTLMTEEEKDKAFKEKQFQQSYINSQIKCNICYSIFKTSEALGSHITQHHIPKKSNPYKCTICSMLFRNEYEFYQHTNIKHTYKYSCNECGHIVYSRTEAIEHRALVHAKKKEKKDDNTCTSSAHTCSYCNLEFRMKKSLEEHLPIHYTYFCSVCGQSFVSKKAVHIHISIKHEEMYNSHIKLTYDPDRTSQLYCGECEVQFVSAHAYNRHLTMKPHMVATAIECDTEDNQNEVQTEKVANSKPTPTDRSMNCHICGVFLQNVKTARNHYKEQHTTAEYEKHIYTTVLKCDQCDYTTRNPLRFRHHIRRHNIDFTIPCPSCGKRFATVARLNVHKLVHTEETPYECAHCNKRFKSRQRTNFHISTVHLKIPYMPWVRRAERRKQERALLRQEQAKESQGKDKNKSLKKNKLETMTEKEVVEQDNMMYEEQYTATEYLNNFVRSGNVVFGTNSRY